jgi:hypothetical protein
LWDSFPSAHRMTTPTPQSYPVPKPLWDALESALMAKSRELIRDIAKNLKQDEKTLMTAFRANKKNLYLIDVSDPTDDRWQCEALQQTTSVAHRCRKPVQYGERYCPAHHFWCMPESCKSKPILRRVKTEEGDVYYVDTLTQQVYTVNFERVGYSHEDTLTVFEIEESGGLNAERKVS